MENISGDSQQCAEAWTTGSTLLITCKVDSSQEQLLSHSQRIFQQEHVCEGEAGASVNTGGCRGGSPCRVPSGRAAANRRAAALS